MNNKNIYGPPLVKERKFDFYLRKFKREITYFYMLFTAPVFSYEFLRYYYQVGNLNMMNIFKTSMKSLLLLGPIYAGFSAYFMYIPKEKFWEKLERKRKMFEMNDKIVSQPKQSLLEELKTKHNN